MKKLTIMIGCFNERPTISKAIEEAKALKIEKEIIVIDNCSTDGTKEILESFKNDKEVKIILHSKNMGAGYSGWEGRRLAQGEYFYAPGADLEYNMEDVYKMLEKIETENLDIVFGSRIIGIKSISILKLIKHRPHWLGTIIATFLINCFYRRNFTDVIATKLIKTNILKNLTYKSNGHAAEFELVSRLCKKGYKIAEVPVVYKPRTHKEGKTIKAIDILPAVVSIFKVKFFDKEN